MSNFLYWPQVTPTFTQHNRHAQKNQNCKLLMLLVWKYGKKIVQNLKWVHVVPVTPPRQNFFDRCFVASYEVYWSHKLFFILFYGHFTCWNLKVVVWWILGIKWSNLSIATCKITFSSKIVEMLPLINWL